MSETTLAVRPVEGMPSGVPDWRVAVQIALPSAGAAVWGVAEWDEGLWSEVVWTDLCGACRGVSWERGSDVPG
jgi:hypothetical protein